MAMGTKQARQKQEELFYASERTETPGHPFYEQLNRVLDQANFDTFCEERCRGFYHAKVGRPSLAPGVYFRLLLIGFFEGISSERGIAWRVADSFSLRRFLNYGLDEVGSHLHFAAFTPEINTALLRLGFVDDLLILIPNDARLRGLEALSGSIHLGEDALQFRGFANNLRPGGRSQQTADNRDSENKRRTHSFHLCTMKH